MDSEKFLRELSEAVNTVRASEYAREVARPGSTASYRAALDHRRHRDELTSLVSRHPEEFVGLLVDLVRRIVDLEIENQTHARMDDRIAKLEAAMFDSQDNIDTPLGYLRSRVEALEERA